MNPPKSKRRQLKGYARYSSIAMQMLAVILAGAYGGVRLDAWTGTRFPLFTLLLSLLAVVAAIYLVTKDLMKKE